MKLFLAKSNCQKGRKIIMMILECLVMTDEKMVKESLARSKRPPVKVKILLLSLTCTPSTQKYPS